MNNDQQEAYWFRYSATLRISGNNVDFEEISSQLGLEPTHTHRKGDPAKLGGQYEHDMWLYNTPIPKTQPLDEHLQTLWASLKPHKAYLLELKNSFTVNIICSYRTNSSTAGFNVSPTSLQMFIELDLPFDVSVIVAGDELRRALQSV